MKTLGRYLAFQLPGLLALVTALIVLSRWVEIPPLAIAGITLVWIAKDLALYRVVKRAYEVDPRSEMDKLVGSVAEVRRPLAPRGYVRLAGELWRAQAAPGEALPIRQGCVVRVRSSVGLTLVVARIMLAPPDEPSGPPKASAAAASDPLDRES